MPPNITLLCVWSITHNYVLIFTEVCTNPDGYNRYVEVIGGSIGAGACANVNRSAKVYKINDDTKMLHFLSEEEVGGDNDWLFIVIEDIVSSVYFQVLEEVLSYVDNHLQVSFHNEFLQDIFRAIASPEQSHVRTCFPDQQEEYFVYPTEVNSDVCIVPKAEGLVKFQCNFTQHSYSGLDSLTTSVYHMFTCRRITVIHENSTVVYRK